MVHIVQILDGDQPEEALHIILVRCQHKIPEGLPSVLNDHSLFPDGKKPLHFLIRRHLFFDEGFDLLIALFVLLHFLRQLRHALLKALPNVSHFSDHRQHGADLVEIPSHFLR